VNWRQFLIWTLLPIGVGSVLAYVAGLRGGALVLASFFVGGVNVMGYVEALRFPPTRTRGGAS